MRPLPLLAIALFIIPAVLAEYPDPNTAWAPESVAQAYADNPNDAAAAIGRLDAAKRTDLIMGLTRTLDGTTLKAMVPALKQHMPSFLETVAGAGKYDTDSRKNWGAYIKGSIVADIPETQNIRTLLQEYFGMLNPAEMQDALPYASGFFERPGNLQGAGATTYVKTLWRQQNTGQEPTFDLSFEGTGATIIGTIISNKYADGEAVSVDISKLKDVKVVALKDGGFSIINGDKTLDLGKKAPFTQPVTFTMDGDKGQLASQGNPFVTFTLGDITAVSAAVIEGRTGITYKTATATLRGIVNKNTIATLSTASSGTITTVTATGFSTLGFTTPQGDVNILAKGEQALIDLAPNAWRVSGKVKIVTDNGFTKTLTISSRGQGTVTAERVEGNAPAWPGEGSANRALIENDKITLENNARVNARMAGPNGPAGKAPSNKDIVVEYPNPGGIRTVWTQPLKWDLDIIGPTENPDRITVLSGSQFHIIKPRITPREGQAPLIDFVPARGTLVRENIVEENDELLTKVDVRRDEAMREIDDKLKATIRSLDAANDKTASDVMKRLRTEQQRLNDFQTALRESDAFAIENSLNPSTMTLDDLDRLVLSAKKTLDTMPKGGAKDAQRDKAAKLTSALNILFNDAQDHAMAPFAPTTTIGSLRPLVQEKIDNVEAVAKQHPEFLKAEAARLLQQKTAWEADRTAIPVDIKSIVVDDTPSFPLTFATREGTTTMQNDRIIATTDRGTSTVDLKQDLTLYEKHDTDTTTLRIVASPDALIDFIGDKARSAIAGLSPRTREALKEPITLETVTINHVRNTVHTESFSAQELAGKLTWAEMGSQIGKLNMNDMSYNVPSIDVPFVGTLGGQRLTVPAKQLQLFLSTTAQHVEPHQAFAEFARIYTLDIKSQTESMGKLLEQQVFGMLPFPREISSAIASHVTFADQINRLTPGEALSFDKVVRDITLPGTEPGMATARLELDPAKFPPYQPTPAEQLLTRPSAADARQWRDLAKGIRDVMTDVNTAEGILSSIAPNAFALAKGIGDYYLEQNLPVKNWEDLKGNVLQVSSGLDGLAQRLENSADKPLPREDTKAIVKSTLPALHFLRTTTSIQLDKARDNGDTEAAVKYQTAFASLTRIIRLVEAGDTILSEQTPDARTITTPPLVLEPPVEIQRKVGEEFERSLTGSGGEGNIQQLKDLIETVIPAAAPAQKARLEELKTITIALQDMQRQAPDAMKAQQDLFTMIGLVPGKPGSYDATKNAIQNALIARLRSDLKPALMTAAGPQGLSRAMQAILIQPKNKNLLDLLDKSYELKNKFVK